MLKMLFLLPFADFKSISVPQASDAAMSSDAVSPELILGLILCVVIFCLVLGVIVLVPSRSVRPNQRPTYHSKPKNWIVVDGSNVMHWQDNTPQLAPLLQVVEDLKARGFDPGMVFDANVGWKLFGRYQGERDLGRMLGLPTDQILVVPKGTQADPYILDTARKFSARIVTNDRYRDWAEAHPEVAEPGFLVRGGMRDGKVWLAGVEAAHKIDAVAQS